MPLPNKLPASLRYFKARLRSLSQPSFWGTAIGLSVIGLVTWNYWLNPELQSSLQNSNDEVSEADNSPYPSLSREDSSIGADIDNLPVLLQEVNPPVVPGTPTSQNNNQPNNLNGSAENSLAQKQAPLSTATQPNRTTTNNITETNTPVLSEPSNSDNPFLVQAQKQLRAGSLYNLGTSGGGNSDTTSPSEPATGQTAANPSIQVPNSINKNQSAAPVNSAQASSNQSVGINNTFIPDYSQATTNTSGQSLPNSSLPNQIALPANAGTVTGYNLPPVTNTPANSFSDAAPIAPPVTLNAPTNTNIAPSSVQVPSQVNNGVASPQSYPSFGTSQLQPSQLRQPNSGTTP